VGFAIKLFDAVALRRAKVFEAAMFERMMDMKALIVRPVVALPIVITDMSSGNNAAAPAALGFRLRAAHGAGGASGMCPWFARGGFFSRSSRRCENPGRARKRVRANGITKVISFSSPRSCTN